MTLHIPYSHQCGSCQAFYIPYDETVPCPRCGTVETERFPYIPQAAGSVRFNLDSYGSYVPPAWYTGSLGDHILYILFNLFEGHRQQGESVDFTEFSAIMLGRMDWGDQAYLRQHVQDIALRVYPLLKAADTSD